MDKKCAARGGNCFADFGHRSCRSLPAFSCRLLPASRLTGSDPTRSGRSLSDYHPETPIIASLIFPQQCDQSRFRLATNSNCDAHRGKSRKYKSEVRRRMLSCVSHGEVSTEFQSKTTSSEFYLTRHSSLLTWAQCRINARLVYDPGTNISRSAVSARRNLDGPRRALCNFVRARHRS